jgi:hypothetical protein
MTDQKNPTDKKEKSLANKVIELIIKDCKLVHNQQKEPYAIVNNAGVRRVYGITSKSFMDWVASRYYAAKKSALSESSFRTVISTLSGKAVYEGDTVDIYTRIAKTEEGYWLDLCNDRWETVLINKTGWKVLSGKSVPLFFRSNSMQAIPPPLFSC